MIEGLFQPTHLIFIALIALIVLGPAKLGDVGGALGRSIREFRENSTDVLAPSAGEKRVVSKSVSGISAGSPDSLDVPDTRSKAIHASDV
jgi:sec-independent protein translocase protein TatA